mmetsp:Transcript_34547/g.33752  ORF Transcript_34547/g.33752 Transcript_34547/m.33752 type:complete len:84 (+) Transcript_34547:188-439(+)
MEFVDMVSFDETYFFYFCLPPIVFSAGYNMKRKMFFENFNNVVLFGIISTIFQFLLFATFTYLVMQWGALQKFNLETGEWEVF